MNLRGLAYRLSLQVTGFIDKGEIITLEEMENLICERKVLEHIKTKLNNSVRYPNFIMPLDEVEIKEMEERIGNRSPLIQDSERYLSISNQNNGYLALLEIIITMFSDGDI